jgi:hypothetical protein
MEQNILTLTFGEMRNKKPLVSINEIWFAFAG